MNERDELNLLLIGPQLRKDESNLGGATVLFMELVNHIHSRHIKHNIVNTQKFNAFASPFRNWIHVVFQTIRLIPQHRVVFLNVSQNGFIFLCPVTFILCRIFGKKLVIRPFGGWLLDIFRQAGTFKRFVILQTVLNADLLYLETQRLVEYFSLFCSNVRQLVNSRPTKYNQLPVSNYRKRFIYIGHIKRTKGILELLEAQRRLEGKVQIDLYGPILDKELDFIIEHPNYKGALNRDQISKILKDYDVLVLPTYYHGEGYPGVIVEAYACGLPVITTQWKSIPEMVIQDNTGYLIQPKSVEDIVNAISGINDENYRKLSENAFFYFNQHLKSDVVLDQVITDLLRISYVTPQVGSLSSYNSIRYE